MKKIPNDMLTGAIHESKNCGPLEIVQYDNAHSVKVRFLRTGKAYTFSSGNIRKGTVRDLFSKSVCGIGFVGNGAYRVRVNNALTKSYQAWSDMIKRCYSPKRQRRQPTYIGCTVCDEWHNYQAFAKWYHENLPDGDLGYEVDKDIRNPGNKVYSPEFCTIVSAKENRMESSARNTTREYRIVNQDGDEVVIVNMAKYCRENNLHKSGMSALIVGKVKSHKGHSLP